MADSADVDLKSAATEEVVVSEKEPKEGKVAKKRFEVKKVPFSYFINRLFPLLIAIYLL